MATNITKKMGFWAYWRKRFAVSHLYVLPAFTGLAITLSQPDPQTKTIVAHVLCILSLQLLVLGLAFWAWRQDCK